MGTLLCSLFSALVVAPGVSAQAAPDSAKTAGLDKFFDWQDAIVAGGFVAGAIGMSFADRRLAHTLQDPSLQESVAVSDGAKFFRFMGQPAPEIIGVVLYGAGRLTHQRPIAALGLHGLEALALSAGITTIIKNAAGRARPYVNVDTVPHDFQFLRGLHKGNDYQSFPSGHTATAFSVAAAATGATLVWIQRKKWSPVWGYAVGTTLFGGATLVGISRMYHDQHWASDVVAGAAVGTFSGFKVVKYAYRHPDNVIDRVLLPLSLGPGPERSLAISWSRSVR